MSLNDISSAELSNKELQAEDSQKIYEIQSDIYDPEFKWFIGSKNRKKRNAEDDSDVNRHLELDRKIAMLHRYGEDVFQDDNNMDFAPQTEKQLEAIYTESLRLESEIKRKAKEKILISMANPIANGSNYVKNNKLYNGLLFLTAFFTLPERQDEMTDFIEIRFRKNVGKFNLRKAEFLLIRDVCLSFLPLLLAIIRLRAVKFLSWVGIVKIMKSFLG